MKKGNTRDVEVTFPEDYHAENLKGKGALFKIDVIKLERGELPTVDEEFIKTFGVESGDEKDFKVNQGQMARELSMTLKNLNKTKILMLLKNSDTPVPESAIKSELNALKKQSAERRRRTAFDPDQLPDELFAEQAERRVRLGILLGATVKKLELKADADRVKALVDEMATAYDDPEQVVNFYYSKQRKPKANRSLALRTDAEVLESES